MRVRSAKDSSDGFYLPPWPLTHLTIGFARVGSDGSFTGINRPFAEMGRFTAADLTGTDWLQLFISRDRRDLEAALHSLAANGSARLRAEAVRKDGVPLFLDLTLVPLFDAEGRRDGHGLLVIDVTESVRMERELDAFREWLQEGSTQFENQLARVREQTLQLQARTAELELANARLESQVTTDGLTGLKNHRTFHERLREEVERAVRYRSALSVVLLDVDDFKTYNDTFGHPAGDDVLRAVAHILQENARTADVVARYGGEEFALILPETDAESARITAERCRHAIEARHWEYRGVTASFGIAAFSLSAPDAAYLVARADRALYRSKRRGRNCVTRAGDPLDASEGIAADPDAAIDTAQQTLDLSHETDPITTRAVKERLSRSYDSTVECWSRILDLQDKETEGHSKRVTAMTVRLARAVGMSEDEVLYVKWGALLHDIGKMAVPNTILHKPGALTEEEWAIMRRHPVMAYEMLAPISFLGPALDIPHYHHEKWDGTGYPSGLKGDEIPLPTRLFAVVDVYDALRTDRPYRKAWSETRVRKHLREQAGTHFDPRAVRTFLKVLDEARPTNSSGSCSG